MIEQILIQTLMFGRLGHEEPADGGSADAKALGYLTL
jgi:hypothetical protein